MTRALRTGRARLAIRGALVPALAAGLACAAFRHKPGPPRVDSVRPDSVFMARGAVVEVVVKGRDFTPGAPGRNTVRFGDAIAVTNVPASGDGKEIRFVIPDEVRLRGDAAPQPLEAGRYPLRVETALGVSNPVVVRVYR